MAGALYCFITKGFSKDIEVATLEQHGDAYQRPLELLLENIQLHQLLAHQYLESAKDRQEAQSRTRAQIDSAVESLHAVDARIGSDSPPRV